MFIVRVKSINCTGFFKKKKLFSEQWCSEYNSGSSSSSIFGSTSSSLVVSGSIIKHVWASFLSFLLELKELVPLAFLYAPFSGWSRLKFPLLTLLVFFYLTQLSLAWQREAEWRKQGKIAERKMQQKWDGSVWGLEREAAWRRTNPWDEGSTVEVEAVEEDRRWKHSGGGEAVEEDGRWKPQWRRTDWANYFLDNEH